MASDDFGYCWRTVRLYCPAAPTFLAREWVNAAWRQLLAFRHWGFLRAQLTVTPLPTDQYLVVPADFSCWRVIVDQSRQVRIPFRYSLTELAIADPGQTAQGQVMALVAATPSTDPLTLGRARYLYHPYGATSTLTCVYDRMPSRLDDTSVFPGVLAQGGGAVLIEGALAQAALWPGTGDKPNPYFNAGLATAKANEFRIGIQSLALHDDEQYPDDLWDSWEECDCCALEGADPRSTDASSYSGTWYTTGPW
jgi:hypothetical protein